MKERIHFTHGNGFPSLCYSQFLGVLSRNYDICYLDRVGHNPDYPVTENWPHLVDEVIASVERQNDRPVIAIGHSLGAVLSLLAAKKKPELFQAVIMLDAPILNPIKSALVRFAKAINLIDNITPAGKTKGRRKHWNSREEVLEYLKSRPLFKTFTESCLEDYITYGLVQQEDGFHLRFDREIEYQIYRTLPDDLLIQSKVETPTALIYGDQSTVVTRIDRLYMRKKFGIKIASVEGTHLFPFEIPEKAAEKVIKILGEISPYYKL